MWRHCRCCCCSCAHTLCLGRLQLCSPSLVGSLCQSVYLAAVFHAVQESFDPIMDLGSNTDLLPVMLYARRAGEWDYSNCLTLLLRHKVSRRRRARLGCCHCLTGLTPVPCCLSCPGVGPRRLADSL